MKKKNNSIIKMGKTELLFKIQKGVLIRSPRIAVGTFDIHFLPIASAAFDGSTFNKFHIDEIGQWESL